MFQSRPLLAEVGQERTRLWVHSAILERFPTLLMLELDASPNLQDQRCLLLENIDPDIFGWCCEYAYTGNYTFIPSRGRESTQKQSIRLQNFEFDGPFAVVIPPYQIERLHRSDLAYLTDHSRIHSFASKYQWEQLRLLSVKKLRDSILNLRFPNRRTNELLRYFMEEARSQVPLEETPSW